MEKINQKGKIAALIGCTFMLSIVYMSLTSWSVAVNELATEFKLSTTMIQAGASFLIAGYAIGSFVEGKMVVKFGWKKTFYMVVIPFIIASALIPLMTNYYIILFLRFVQGWGCMVAVTCAIVSSWFPSKERGLALGILLGAIGLGSALGGFIGGILNPVVGWKNTFWIITALAVVGVIIFHFMVKEAPPLEEEIQTKKVEKNTKIPTAETNLFKEPGLWLLGLATLCAFFSAYGMYAYLAEYLYTLDYSVRMVGTMVFVNGFIAVLATPIIGWVSDKMVATRGAQKARTFANAWFAFFVAFVGYILMPHLAPMGIGMAIFVSIVVGWGVPATNGPGLSLPSDLFGSAAAGPGVGMVVLIAGAGGIIAPVFVPWLAGVTNWTIAWYATALPCLIGLIINLILGNYKMKKVTDYTN